MTLMKWLDIWLQQPAQNLVSTLVGRLNSQHIRTCTTNKQSTYTLHLTARITYAYLIRNDRYQNHLSCFHYSVINHTCPQDCSLSFLLAQHYTSKCVTATSTFDTPAITLEHQSMDTDPWYAMTIHKLTTTAQVRIKNKFIFTCSIDIFSGIKFLTASQPYSKQTSYKWSKPNIWVAIITLGWRFSYSADLRLGRGTISMTSLGSFL